MAEYIERKRVVDVLTKVAAQEATGIRRRTLIRMLDAVEQLPSSPPVAPVRHGEWLHNENYVLWAERYICSMCGRNAPSDGDYRHKLTDYCPHCGAFMGGADNG